MDHPLTGTVYLAAQGDNPFGSLIAIYIVIDDPASGVLVKLAGKVEPDPVSGQLRTLVAQNPQQPIEDIALHLSGGPRATFTTPPTCGTYATATELVPWTAPEGPTAHPSDSFQISAAAAGGPCAQSEAALPNAPVFEAGTQAPLAGMYSPFVLKLSRENGSQRLGALNVTLPPGLTGSLAGTAECPEAQIAAAIARSAPGQGALEQASPSCPADSQLGTATVGAGSGSPLYVQGRAYLAGPYKGAPLSMAIITPAIAGPFDLGVVVVRSALYVDETSAQITVRSDPIPTILHGVPLDVRSIAIAVSRDRFTLNPTSCEAEQVSAEAISTAGQVAPLSNRFQVGGCGGLGFSPKLALSLKGGTRRTKHPKLRSVLTYPTGSYANTAKVALILPKSEFIDPRRVGSTCIRPLFAEGRCPPSSVLGHAKAYSPLLAKPLTGKVYFRANGGARKLPDIVLDLHGQVHLVAVGYVDAVVKKGTEISRIRTTFAKVPDAPLSRVVIEPKAASRASCKTAKTSARAGAARRCG